MTTHQKINYFIIAVFIIGAGYLASHLIFVAGRLAQKANMACVDAYELSQFEDTLELAQAICVDVQQNQLQEIKNIYNKQLSDCQKDAKHWKDSYFWLKKQHDNPE